LAIEREPLSDDRLRRHPQLLITPHCAFYSIEAAPEMRRKGAQEALRLLQGKAPRCAVNLPFIRNARTNLSG
jgi:phosphoglycerate dehydrogenase-like enzyme